MIARIEADDNIPTQNGRTQSGRLARRVMLQLVQDLHSGRYAIGARLPSERELANQMGVSRPVIREAIIALEVIGLVTSRLGSGTYVDQLPRGVALPLIEGSPLEIIEALSALECAAVANAARNMNERELAAVTAEIQLLDKGFANFETWHRTLAQVHRRFADACNNDAIAALINHLWKIRLGTPVIADVERAAWEAGTLRPGRYLFAVVSAVLERDGCAAAAALRACHQASIDAVLDVIAQSEIRKARKKVSDLRSRFLTDR